jgi:hypothetical protein
VTGAVVGFLIGGLIGAFGYVKIRALADRIAVARSDDAGRRTADLLRSSAVINFVLFAVAGLVSGWLLYPVD